MPNLRPRPTVLTLAAGQAVISQTVGCCGLLLAVVGPCDNLAYRSARLAYLCFVVQCSLFHCAAVTGRCLMCVGPAYFDKFSFLKHLFPICRYTPQLSSTFPCNSTPFLHCFAHSLWVPEVTIEVCVECITYSNLDCEPWLFPLSTSLNLPAQFGASLSVIETMQNFAGFVVCYSVQCGEVEGNLDCYGTASSVSFFEAARSVM
jgi:hypothetical protein